MSQLLSAAAGFDTQWLTSASVPRSRVCTALIALRYVCHSHFCKTQELLGLFAIHTLFIQLPMRTCRRWEIFLTSSRGTNDVKDVDRTRAAFEKTRRVTLNQVNCVYMLDTRNLSRMICSEDLYKVFLGGGGYVIHEPTSGKHERNLDLFLIQKIIWYKKK